jgi:hypothetical protein
MMKPIFFIIVIFTATHSEYKNYVAATIGVPDYINLKYTRQFDKWLVGINTGVCPVSIFIPGISLGYRFVRYSRYSMDATFLTAYWPAMSFTDFGPMGQYGTRIEFTEDWLHIALRPDCSLDIGRLRISAGFGFDAIFIIKRTPAALEYYKFKPFYSPGLAIGFLF